MKKFLGLAAIALVSAASYGQNNKLQQSPLLVPS